MVMQMRVVAAMPIALGRAKRLAAGMATFCPEFEFCDDGYTDACGSCNADCSAAGGATCGDGEQSARSLSFCDDGFADACGSCNADCSAVGLEQYAAMASSVLNLKLR